MAKKHNTKKQAGQHTAEQTDSVNTDHSSNNCLTLPSTGFMRKNTAVAAMFLAFVLGIATGSFLPSVFTPVQTQKIVGVPTVSPTVQKEPQQPALSREQVALINDLEKKLLQDQNNSQLWARLGNAYFDSGQSTSAIKAYQHSLALAPDNPDVLTDLGIMYRDTGQYEQALKSFTQALKIKPQHNNALFNQGIVLYYDLGLKKEAEQIWRQLLTINPQARTPDGRTLTEMLEQLQ